MAVARKPFKGKLQLVTPLVAQPAVPLPMKKSHAKKRSAESLAVDALARVGTGYPYQSVYEMLWAKRASWTLRGSLTPEKVQEIAAAFREKANANELDAMLHLQKALDLGSWAKNALEAGAIVAGIGGAIGAGVGLAAAGIGAAAGAAAGSSVPIIGTLIGAAIGFIIGVATTLIPVEKWDVMNKFHDLTSKLAPIERYFLWSGCRKAQDNARALDKRSPLPPWWLKTPEFYTIYGGLDAVSVFCYEDLARQEAFLVSQALDPINPLNLTAWDPVALYGTAVVASHAGPDERLRDSLFWRNTVEEGKGSPNLIPFLRAAQDMKNSELRAKIIALGVTDFPALQVTDDLVIRVHQREKELAAKGA